MFYYFQANKSSKLDAKNLINMLDIILNKVVNKGVTTTCLMSSISKFS